MGDAEVDVDPTFYPPVISQRRSSPILLFPPILRQRPSPHHSPLGPSRHVGALSHHFLLVLLFSFLLLLRSTITNPLPTLAPTGPLTDAAAIAEAEKRASKKEE
jgi:hypothetical protein